MIWRNWVVAPEMEGVIRPDLGASYYRPNRAWALWLWRRLERNRRGRYGFRWVMMRGDHPDLQTNQAVNLERVPS